MKTRLKNIFLNNIGLKLLAILFAVGLWFLVMNFNDPTQTKTFTTNVSVVNQEAILDQGKYYEILSGNTVTFRVSAKRSVLEQLSGEDFEAYADMEYIDDTGRVPIAILANKYGDQITIPTKTYYMEVRIGKAVSNQFTIVPKTSGDPAVGYGVESVNSDTKTVTVYGPDDVVSSIAAVEAILPVDNASDDVTGEVALTAVDSKGNQVDTTKLDFSKDKVKVTATLVMVKNATIKVNTTGALADGLQLVSVTAVPSNVVIKGDSKNLNRVSEIEIPGQVINLSNITGDFETTVDINQYLPPGVTTLNASDGTVRIIVDVTNKISKTFKIATDNLNINNLADRLVGRFEDEFVNVEIVGLPEDLNKLDEKKINGYVDASGLNKGTHSVNVNLQLDPEYQPKTTTTRLIIE